MSNDAASGNDVPPGNPELTVVATLCGGGSCPTVYRTDRGTLLVQGKAITAHDAGLDLPPGEVLVEVPAELLTRTDL